MLRRQVKRACRLDDMEQPLMRPEPDHQRLLMQVSRFVNFTVEDFIGCRISGYSATCQRTLSAALGGIFYFMMSGESATQADMDFIKGIVGDTLAPCPPLGTTGTTNLPLCQDGPLRIRFRNCATRQTKSLLMRVFPSAPITPGGGSTTTRKKRVSTDLNQATREWWQFSISLDAEDWKSFPKHRM